MVVERGSVRQKLLRLLKEDEEFRLAVAGYIGLREILDELKKLREDFQLFVKEQEKRWEENERRWREANERFLAIENELKKLREDFQLFVKEQEKRWEEANRRFSRIEIELGSLSESVYSRYVYEDLREEISAKGEKILSRVRNADFDGVEVDLLIDTSGAVYVVEVKIRPSTDDIAALLAKTSVIQQKFGKPVVAILTGALIGREVELYARSRGVKVYRY